jgi:hypothetical protein
VLSCVLLLGVAGVVTYALLATNQHPGGDPHNAVLLTLQKIKSAVPAGASDVSMQSYDATWMGACQSDPNSHAGWVEARVNVDFTDAAPVQAVKTEINAALVRLRWVRHDFVITRGQGPTAHWTRPIPFGRRADAFAFPVPAGSTSWVLTATWQPPGPTVDTGTCA